jgi:hypothetical protein
MGDRKKKSSTLFLAGVGAGLVVGTAHLALAKLQCDSDRLHGRSHSVAIASWSVDGVPSAVPTDAADPTAVIKTELYDYPQMVHLDAFDPGATPPTRKMHLVRAQ